MKTMLRTLAILVLPLLMAACGGSSPSDKDTQANVDSGNTANNAQYKLGLKLYLEEVDVENPETAKKNVHSMTTLQLTTVQSDLSSYIENLRIVRHRIEQPNVKFSGNPATLLRRQENAENILTVVRQQLVASRK